MSSGSIRVIGFIFLLAAIVTAILNLHRVADLGMSWLAPLLMIIGIGFVVIAKKQAG